MLTPKQRAYLRKIASSYDTIIQIGKGGINDNTVKTVADALEARELIKCRVLENSEYTPREAADELSEKIGADVVIVIGTKFVLFKESEKNKRISLEI